MKPRMLDLFCGGGGASVGYARAGWDVVGVDLNPMPRYPFTFYQADALEFLDAGGSDGFDAVHASPPCQRYSAITKMHGRETVEAHPGLIAPVRDRLRELGIPYVIENVERARAELLDPVMLCGSMFDLRSGPYYLRRHRLFESSPVSLWPPASCAHGKLALAVYGHPGGSSRRDGRSFGSVEDWRTGMGIDWMSADELAEAIPPAYSEHIGRALIAALAGAAR